MRPAPARQVAMAPGAADLRRPWGSGARAAVNSSAAAPWPRPWLGGGGHGRCGSAAGDEVLSSGGGLGEPRIGEPVPRRRWRWSGRNLRGRCRWIPRLRRRRDAAVREEVTGRRERWEREARGRREHNNSYGGPHSTERCNSPFILGSCWWKKFTSGWCWNCWRCSKPVFVIKTRISAPPVFTF